jgi:hypothetical protein
MTPPESDQRRPKRIRFRELSKGWRLTLVAEWACLGWLPLSVLIVLINDRTGWPIGAEQDATFYRTVELMLVRSILGLVMATLIHIACLERPRVCFPLGCTRIVLAVCWVVVFLGVSMPVF